MGTRSSILQKNIIRIKKQSMISYVKLIKWFQYTQSSMSTNKSVHNHMRNIRIITRNMIKKKISQSNNMIHNLATYLATHSPYNHAQGQMNFGRRKFQQPIWISFESDEYLIPNFKRTHCITNIWYLINSNPYYQCMVSRILNTLSWCLISLNCA